MANNFGREVTIIPTITTNFQTRRGALANVFDGPFNQSGWTPNGASEPIPGSMYGATEMNYFGASPGGNKGLWIAFDFGEPVSAGVFRFMASSGTDMGQFKVQVSQGGTIWRDFTPDADAKRMYITLGQLFFPDMPASWDSEWGVVPYRLGTGKFPEGSPWFADEDGKVNSLFFRHWRLLGVSGGNNDGYYVSDFRPLDGDRYSAPFSVYTLDLMTKQGYDREAGDWFFGGSDHGTGFGTQPPTVLADPMDARDGTRHDPDEWYDKVVPADEAPITYPPDDIPDTPDVPGANGGPIVRSADYFHPYSRGWRGPKYNASTAPSARGNGVDVTYQAGSPPADIFSGPESAVDWNFGAGAGNGPYLGSCTVGTKYIVDFPEPVMLTSMLAVTGNSVDNHGKWKLQAFAGDGVDTIGLFDAGHAVKATITNSNRTVTSNATGADSGARAKDAASRFTGKWVFEVNYPAGSLAGFGVGVMQDGSDFATISAGAPSVPHGAIILRPDGMLDIGGLGGVNGGGSIGSTPGGNRVMLAFDFDAKRVYVKNGSNAWTGDPAAGTGGFPFNLDYSATPTQLAPQFPFAVFGDTGRAAQFFTSGFTNTIPAGFEAWPEYAGAWVDISGEQPFAYGGNVVNSRWGGAVEFTVEKNLAKTARRFALTCSTAGGGGRMWTEILFGIAASALMGGYRDPADPAEDGSFVTVTSTFAMQWAGGGGDGNHDADQTTPEREAWFNRLVAGPLTTFNGGADGEAVVTSNTPKTNTGSGSGKHPGYMAFHNANDPAGNYIQFTFSRGVNLRGIMPSIWYRNDSSAEALDGSGNPTKWGLWKVTWADDATGPWTDALDGPVTFPDRSFRGVIPVNTGDGLPHSYWRLEKISGNQAVLADGEGIEQFDFLLDDVGPPTPLQIVFADDGGLAVTMTTTEPAQPQEPSNLSVNFKDDGGLDATMKLKFNVRLAATFEDEGVLDVFSALSPSLTVQTSLYQTGRN